MTATIEDLIGQAYKLIGVVGQNRPLDGYQKQEGLQELNGIARSMCTGDAIPLETQLNFNLVAGQAEYTVTPDGSGDITSNVIYDLVRARLWLDDNSRQPIRVIEPQDFQLLSYSGTSTIPSVVFLTREQASSTLNFYDKPDKAYLVNIWCKVAVNEFDIFTPLQNLPTYYEMYLRYRLAKELSNYYPSDAAWDAKKERALMQYERDVLGAVKSDIKTRDSSLLRNGYAFNRYYRGRIGSLT